MNLSDLDHLRNDKRIRFSEEVVNGETLTIVSYMVCGTDLWDISMAIDCRGSVFDASGKCISRPFHKFFNVGENDNTQLHMLQGREFEILEKRDGSMLIPVLVKGEIFWKTKKSFYSEVAVEASQNVPENVAIVAKSYLELGMTPIFEYTSPFNKVVINYGKEPEFVLLAVRDNVTGEYIGHGSMMYTTFYRSIPPVKTIEKFDKTLDQCLDEVYTLTDFEGWCLRDVSTGFYCKLKTSWYLRNHRAQTELRERDVADMVIDETIDDIKSALALDNFDISEIIAIERLVVSQLSTIRGNVDEVIATIEDKTDFKSIALKFKTHPLFGLIMETVRGKEPDFKKYWVNNYRETYSLKCIYNKNF